MTNNKQQLIGAMTAFLPAAREVLRLRPAWALTFAPSDQSDAEIKCTVIDYSAGWSPGICEVRLCFDGPQDIVSYSKYAEDVVNVAEGWFDKLRRNRNA